MKTFIVPVNLSSCILLTMLSRQKRLWIIVLACLVTHWVDRTAVAFKVPEYFRALDISWKIHLADTIRQADVADLRARNSIWWNFQKRGLTVLGQVTSLEKTRLYSSCFQLSIHTGKNRAKNDRKPLKGTKFILEHSGLLK